MRILSVHYTGIACMTIADNSLLSASQDLFSDIGNHFFSLEVNIIRLQILIIVQVHHHYLMLSKKLRLRVHETELIRKRSFVCGYIKSGTMS